MELQDNINRAIEAYFYQASFRKLPLGIYASILPMLERPLIESVLKAVRGNQVRASEVLGFNRNTLRKYCLKYNLKPSDYYVDNTRDYNHSERVIQASV